MTDVNKAYVAKYVKQAESTTNPAIKNDALYRAGSHMEIIPCDGNTNLTPEQQQTVLDEANKLLGGQNG